MVDGGPTPMSPERSTVTPPDATADTDVLALPARVVVSAALWVPTTDATELTEAARMELELGGLLTAKASESSVNLRPIAEENDRTLVAAAIFPTDLPAGLAGLKFRHFDASPLLVRLPANAATVWQEGDDLVICVTRGSEIANWETIDAEASDAEITLWLQLVTCQLQAEKVISQWLEWHDPTGVLASRDITLPEAAKWANTGDSFPPPVWPGKLAEWQPPSAIAVIDHVQRVRKIRQLVYAVAAAYVVLLAVALGYLGFLKFQALTAERDRDLLLAEVQSFEPVSRAWQLIASTVESEQFPLEILHHLVINMPPSGIRLTNLTMADGEIQVEGEASSVTLASGFFASIEADDDFRHVQWEMAPPSLLPNSTARFQMRGNLMQP